MTTYTATYSPDDNKLRLYASARLDPDTYTRIKAAGFRWAPKQDLFFAPSWSPDAEDILIELAGGIDDEDKTLVERAEERADRFGEYSYKRAREADSTHKAVQSICDGIPFGQPILRGHHSERRARKDAERIDHGMRKAINLWRTSEYWTQRAAGALAHAKYKERVDVRARRIRKLEAEQRKVQRHRDDCAKWVGLWSDDTLTLEKAICIAGFCGLHLPRKEGDRPDFNQNPDAYTALTNAYPNLYAPRSMDEVVAFAKEHYPRVIARADRWLEHYNNRLAYERAMLEEQGGTAASKFDLQPGGRVFVRGQWLTILKVNYKDGQPVSVSTNSQYVRVKGIDEIQDYEPPSADQAAAVKAANKLPPLCNYPSDGRPTLTKQEWDRIPKDYKGTQVIDASDGIGAHRVRVAMMMYTSARHDPDFNKRHGYGPVFISDAKVTSPPREQSATPAPAVAPPVRIPSTVKHTIPEPSIADQLEEQLALGIKVVVVDQLFTTPRELADRIAQIADPQPGDRILEPSAGTGMLLGALGCAWRENGGELVAVEVDRDLSNQLRNDFPLTRVCNADFLCIDGPDALAGGLPDPAPLGMFDLIVMNPPFKNAADINHIKQALRFLCPGGRLVAICANGPRQRDILKPMAEESGGWWEDLPAHTFAHAGTNVNTALVVIHAPF